LKFIVSYIILSIFLSCIIQSEVIYAQICDNKYVALSYKGISIEEIKKTIFTKKNEIVSIGHLADFNKVSHISKYTSQGTPIWSYFYRVNYFSFYSPTFYNTAHFTEIINTPDGGFMVAGSVIRDKVARQDIVALIAKIDKFGTPIWSKEYISNGTVGGQANLAFVKIAPTISGNYILYMATDNGKKQSAGEHSYDKIICIDANGVIQWSTYLFSYLFDAGGLGLTSKRAITQAVNKDIIVANVLHKTGPYSSNFVVMPGNLHFFALDHRNGKIKWETNYQYFVPPFDSTFTPDIVSASELPNGKISFITSLYLPISSTGVLAKKAVQIITSSNGQVEKVYTYSPADNSDCEVTDVAEEEGTGCIFLLLNNNKKSIVIKTNAAGQELWSKGYSDNNDYVASSIAQARQGLAVSMCNKTTTNKLLLTTTDGSIDCENILTPIIIGHGPLINSTEAIVTDLNYNWTDPYGEYIYPLLNELYDQHPIITCKQINTCCTDVIDKNNITNISICEGKSFMLPDSTVIKDSGLYYVTYKTLLGCDSITFYKAKIDKDVSTLFIGNDTCLGERRNLTITATPGFDKYYWANNLPPANNSFIINQPGIYSVSVQNTCGSKTDSLEVFEKCDYTIYMPTAFTPNGNRTNDYFGIPPFNKNKLINFSIYNRWGKLIFQTKNQAQAWDGTYKNEPMDAGTYIYYLEMVGLTGNRIAQKGYVLLLR
jgi:gliding motility-associated-like protein